MGKTAIHIPVHGAGIEAGFPEEGIMFPDIVASIPSTAVFLSPSLPASSHTSVRITQ